MGSKEYAFLSDLVAVLEKHDASISIEYDDMSTLSSTITTGIALNLIDRSRGYEEHITVHSFEDFYITAEDIIQYLTDEGAPK